MHKELELWQFISNRLARGGNVMLLAVAESSGSSPGRRGFKMAIGPDGELIGSIGGGVMEVNLVEQSRATLSEPEVTVTGSAVEQVHRKDVPNSSGMICSGRQTVIFKLLTPHDTSSIELILEALTRRRSLVLTISSEQFIVDTSVSAERVGDRGLSKFPDTTDFLYTERLAATDDLFIVGGGHCALALSELMSKMDFRIRIFDDRPELNTLEKNEFADQIEIVESYQKIAEHIDSGPNTYVVVMTLGYAYDKIVIERLIDKEFKYFGVLGSRAKMATLMKELGQEGYDKEKLNRIRTPIGLPINSRTPEEIAVSIAAEIISLKNST